MHQNWQGGACEEQHITVNIYFWYHDIYIYIYIHPVVNSCLRLRCCWKPRHLVPRPIATAPGVDSRDTCEKCALQLRNRTGAGEWMQKEWFHGCISAVVIFARTAVMPFRCFFSIPSLEVLQTIDVELFKKHVQLLTDLRGKDLTPLKKLSTTSVL